MTTKTNYIAILKNDKGNYFIEIQPELCEQLGISEIIEYDIVITENGLEIRRGLKNNDY